MGKGAAVENRAAVEDLGKNLEWRERENKVSVSSSMGFCSQGRLIPPSYRDGCQSIWDIKTVRVTPCPPLSTPLKGSKACLLKSLTPRGHLLAGGGGGGCKKGRSSRADWRGRLHCEKVA